MKTKAKDFKSETDSQSEDEFGVIYLNEPFRSKKFAASRKLSEEDFYLLEAYIDKGEELIFVIAGDLNIKGRYAKSLLAVTDRNIYAFDGTVNEKPSILALDKIDTAFVRRYYGNALLVITPKSENTDCNEKEKAKDLNFIRFSYKVASLFDAAAFYLTNIAAGEDEEKQLDILKSAFVKQFCICPKCGRALIRPGAECVHCRSKDKIFKKLMKYVLPYKSMLLFCLFLSMITTAVVLIPPYMTKTLVDDVLPGGNKDMLWVCVGVLFASYVVQFGVGALRAYLIRATGDKMVADLRNDVYAKAQMLTMRFYDRTSTGSVINRISGDTLAIQQFTLRVTQEVVVQFFLLIGITIIMLVMNPGLTLLSLIPVPLVVVGAKIFGKKIAPYYRRIWRRWSAVTSILTDTIPGIKVIKAFTNEKKSIENFKKYNGKWLKTDISAAKITMTFPSIVSFVITCGSLLIWAIGGARVIDSPELFSPGLLVSFLSYTSMFYGPVTFFANFNDSYQNALNSAERILDIIDAEPEPNFAQGIKPGRLQGKIEFRNVNFSFDKSKKTLSNINITINPGDIVGIVGTTGAGKSTIINLLMRYYDNYDGEILADDINIRDIDMQYYRSQIGYVQQEPMMFHDTIYNNIAYGSENASPESVINAAEVANAHEFIARLPDGYDTVLGERGVGLSGGERQRLSIARAVLRNPGILFFDEATASVDSETESKIQGAIERLICGRTTIMIAHRLSTLRKANKIIVVDNGEILEMGTPEELLAQKGKYYKLVQIQTMSDQLRKSKEEERFD